MFLRNRQIKALLSLTHLVDGLSPGKDGGAFLKALRHLVPHDLSAAFLMLDPTTYQLAPSALTTTNLDNFQTLQDHNQYFWKFKLLLARGGMANFLFFESVGFLMRNSRRFRQIVSIFFLNAMPFLPEKSKFYR